MSSNEKPRKYLYTQFDSPKCDCATLTHDTNKKVPFLCREKNPCAIKEKKKKGVLGE